MKDIDAPVRAMEYEADLEATLDALAMLLEACLDIDQILGLAQPVAC